MARRRSRRHTLAAKAGEMPTVRLRQRRSSQGLLLYSSSQQRGCGLAKRLCRFQGAQIHGSC
eukprot:scaffold27309_cov36-Phaeocystis_antarctica.AAC.1